MDVHRRTPSVEAPKGDDDGFLWDGMEWNGWMVMSGEWEEASGAVFRLIHSGRLHETGVLEDATLLSSWVPT